MDFKKIKHLLVNIIPRDFLPLKWYRKTKISYELKRARGNVVEPRYKSLRVKIIRYYVEEFKLVLSKIGFKFGILVIGDKDYFFCDGIFLNTKSNNRYYKITNVEKGNEGRAMFDFLKAQGIEVSNVVDLGANYGEISLYFSRFCPNARVLSIEASPDNFAIFKDNLSFQVFTTANIIALNEAVSDKRGSVSITRGHGSQNTIIERQGRDMEIDIVSCDTLASLLDRYGFSRVDFLKVDIEGAEPLLLDSIKEKIEIISSVLIEVGSKRDHRDYLPLLKIMWDAGMNCFVSLYNTVPLDSFEKIEKLILENNSIDLWFVKKETHRKTH